MSYYDQNSLSSLLTAMQSQMRQQPGNNGVVLTGELGQPQNWFVKPSDTSYNTLIAADSNAYQSFKHLIAAGNSTSGSASFAINDGSTDWEIATAIAVPTNDSHVWPFDPPWDLPPGHSLKVKTSSANNITFAANGRFIPTRK